MAAAALVEALSVVALAGAALVEAFAAVALAGAALVEAFADVALLEALAGAALVEAFAGEASPETLDNFAMASTVPFKLVDVFRKIVNEAPVSANTILPLVKFVFVDMFCVAHVCRTKHRTKVCQQVPPYCMPATQFLFDNIYHC